MMRFTFVINFELTKKVEKISPINKRNECKYLNKSASNFQQQKKKEKKKTHLLSSFKLKIP